MVKPEHVRATWEGVVGSTVAPLEHWSFSLCGPAEVIDPASPDSTVDDMIAASLKDAYAANIAPLMPTDVVLTGVRLALILDTGKFGKRANGSYLQGKWDGSVGGELQPQQVPLQSAMCVSLNTARAGATGKGRFFLPFPGMALDASTKRWSAAQAQSGADRGAALVSAVADIFTFPVQVVSSKGYMTPVTSVRVGRAPDTMRSRREDLPEGYVSAPLA